MGTERPGAWSKVSSGPDAPTPSGADEAGLVERAQAGDRDAFDQLVRHHQDQVYAVALRMLGNADDAQDVAQDAFIRAFRALRTFRREAKLSTWLVSITMNLCRNRRRWWARRRRVIVASLDDPVETEEGSLAHQVADPSSTPVAEAIRHEHTRYVLQALQALDEASRTVVVLRDIQGLSYEEIAEVLHCRIGTVKSRLNRARLRLKALLDGRLS